MSAIKKRLRTNDEVEYPEKRIKTNTNTNEFPESYYGYFEEIFPLFTKVREIMINKSLRPTLKFFLSKDWSKSVEKFNTNEMVSINNVNELIDEYNLEYDNLSKNGLYGQTKLLNIVFKFLVSIIDDYQKYFEYNGLDFIDFFIDEKFYEIMEKTKVGYSYDVYDFFILDNFDELDDKIPNISYDNFYKEKRWIASSYMMQIHTLIPRNIS